MVKWEICPATIFAIVSVAAYYFGHWIWGSLALIVAIIFALIATR